MNIMNIYQQNSPKKLLIPVDLIDVLEMIADSIAAALARSGGLKYPLEIDKDVLYKAFENTCKMVLDACELKDK